MTPDQIQMLPSMAIKGSLRDRLPAIQAFYFVLAQDGRILYIGSASRLNARWSSHGHKKGAVAGACRVAWIDCCALSRLVTYRLESFLIQAFAPPMNVIGAPKQVIKRKRSKDQPSVRKKSVRIFVRLTPSELDYVKTQAAETSQEVTTFVRTLLGLDANKRGRPKKLLAVY